MRRRIRFSVIYQVILLLLMYIPICVVVIYSFNESRNSTIWTGWSLDWYRKLMKNRSLLEALKNSVILATISSGAAGIIGTLGAVGMAK